MAFGSDARYTDGSYLKQKPTWDDEYAPWKTGMIADILSRNQLQPSSVIEVGCGAGGILAELQKLFPQISNLTGYDISTDAISLARKKENENLKFFAADLFQEETSVQAELVLCIDVIEHVDDFYQFLRALKSRGHKFVFHIPLDLSCRTILKPHVLKYQRDLVGHIHYFSKEMAEWALQDTGFQILDWNYTKPIIDIEKPKRLKSKVKKALRNTSFSIHQNGSAKLWGGYSMMILAE